MVPTVAAADATPIRSRRRNARQDYFDGVMYPHVSISDHCDGRRYEAWTSRLLAQVRPQHDVSFQRRAQVQPCRHGANMSSHMCVLFCL